MAGFIGSPGMNFLEGRIETDSTPTFSADGIAVDLSRYEFANGSRANRAVEFGLRPEHINIGEAAAGMPCTAEVEVEIGRADGDPIRWCGTRYGNQSLTVRTESDMSPPGGPAGTDRVRSRPRLDLRCGERRAPLTPISPTTVEPANCPGHSNSTAHGTSPRGRTILAMVAAAGYSQVEGFGGLYQDPAGLRAMLDANGLSMPTAHFGLDMLENDFGKARSIAETLGVKTVICPHIRRRPAPFRRSRLAKLRRPPGRGQRGLHGGRNGIRLAQSRLRIRRTRTASFRCVSCSMPRLRSDGRWMWPGCGPRRGPLCRSSLSLCISRTKYGYGCQFILPCPMLKDIAS